MVERWIACPDFEGIYEVSSFGRVKRIAPGAGRAKVGAILATARNKKGYHYLNLCRDGRMQTTYVHVLVCRAFHGAKPSALHQAAHADDDKDNNRVENLRWATGLENHADRRRNGRILVGARISRTKLNEMVIPEIRGCIAKGESIGSIARRFGVEAGTIGAIRSGRTWAHVA